MNILLLQAGNQCCTLSTVNHCWCHYCDCFQFV